MRDWILIVSIGVLSVIVGVWAVRRRPVETESPAPPISDEADAPPKAQEPAARVSATNTTVAAPPAMATLEFDGAPGTVAINRPEVVIGRHSEDDIRVPDVRVSRHHARLVAKIDGGFEIQNLTSVRSEPNPMLINGVQKERADIADGDVVSLGGVSFVFRQAA